MNHESSLSLTSRHEVRVVTVSKSKSHIGVFEYGYNQYSPKPSYPLKISRRYNRTGGRWRLGGFFPGSFVNTLLLILLALLSVVKYCERGSVRVKTHEMST